MGRLEEDREETKLQNRRQLSTVSRSDYIPALLLIQLTK